MDHYAEWISKHPESDTSRWDYDQSKDTYYWDQRRLKEAQRKKDAEFSQMPFEDQL